MPISPRLKPQLPFGSPGETNPVVNSAEIALEATSLVTINSVGVSAAARYIRNSMREAQYTPRTWRTHPLHMLPPDDGTLNGAEPVLNWIFLVSALNFSFWSELEDTERYAVEWQAGWSSTEKTRWTGYWCLLAAIDRALDEGIPITDPSFYASPEKCSDDLIRYIFRAAPDSKEGMPLLEERIAILREVGNILNRNFGGSFSTFTQSVDSRGGLTPLKLSTAVTSTFPSFRDESTLSDVSEPVKLWKRAQILSAEAWAAFYPRSPAMTHPLFPGGGAESLTMFADYRVPQILHHLGLLDYPPDLKERLEGLVMLEHGCREEISIRASSIVAVERVAEEIRRLERNEGTSKGRIISQVQTCSVLIDFYLWDLAKRVESGEEGIEGLPTQPLLPPHRTRSIWY